MEVKDFVIFGGSSGIGREIVRSLADLGHRITVVSRTAGDLHERQEGEIIHLPCDLVHDDLGALSLPEQVHGLAYCPGSIRLRPFQRLTPANFWEDHQINLLGAVKAIQSCLPGLKKAKPSGSIVLFSTVAVQTGMPFHASIASAKGAVEGLTRSLAAEFAPKIRVNAIAPSLTDTNLAQALLSDEGRRSAAAARHPLKRIGEPGDIAAAATFLLDDNAGWVTGQVLAVDGGMGTVRTFK